MTFIGCKFIGNTWLLPGAGWTATRLLIFLLSVGYFSARAQVCPASQYQPVFTESFGSGNQRPSLASRTTYNYRDGTCPEDGEYTLIDFVDGACFDSVWHFIPEDHTPGDVKGNFLLINSGFEGGEFYKQPLTGLCPGTTYEFSLWGTNLIKPGQCDRSLLPTLTAQVETPTGQVLQTLAIGSIPVTSTPVWLRYAGVFTVPDSVSQVVIHLLNNKGGCGNDFGIDDIEMKQCSACAPVSLYVPDAFTPNNDGMNDEFSVFLRGSSAFDLKIYNQWGSLIFTSISATSRWNGTYAGQPCLPGAYTWVITYQPATKTSAPVTYVKTGRVLLVR